MHGKKESAMKSRKWRLCWSRPSRSSRERSRVSRVNGKIVISCFGVPIRLTGERMAHIESRHPELKDEEQRILETIAAPDQVQEGDARPRKPC